MGSAWSGRRKPQRIERWRADARGSGVFAVSLTAGDGAKHHRRWWDYLSARHILVFNQAITLFFALVVAGLSLFISIQLNKEEVISRDEQKSDTLGIEFQALAALGLFIAVSMAQGITATVNLHLGQMGVFLFAVLFIIPALLLFALVMTDLQFVFSSYLRHRWDTNALRLLREETCARSPHRRCAAPVLEATKWCVDKFGQTDCGKLRKDGIKQAWKLVRGMAGILAAMAWVEAAMLFWCVRLVAIIVTVPIIMRSAMRFYIYVLLPLAVVAVFIGREFETHPAVKIEDDVARIGSLFISAGVTMLVAMVVGRLSAHVRSAGGMATFVVLVLTVIVLCAVITFYALTLFVIMPDRLDNKGSGRPNDLDELACELDLHGCSNCTFTKCPEWRTGQIIKYAQAYIKFSGFLSIVSIPPWIVALYVAFTLYIDFRGYQSAFV